MSGLSLSRAALESALRTTRFGRSLDLRAETGSTMDDARAIAAEVPEGHVVVADLQTAGRGSRGRRWESPAGDDLYLSVVLKPTAPAASLGALTLALGAAVAEAVEALVPGVEARVKWPNDVLIGGRKCAGLLVEARALGSEAPTLIAGLGLNVNRASFPEGLAATSLAREAGAPLDRAEALAVTLGKLEAAYDRYLREGPGSAVAAIEARLAWVGEAVRCGDVFGKLVGLAPDGALRIATATGERQAIAGQLERLAQ